MILAGCIENDVPYPIVVADITAFEVEGQTGVSVIDTKNRTVGVTLGEGADIQNLAVLQFAVNNDATVSPAVPDHLNLSSPAEYKLTTYQDYLWTITASQPIERYVDADNLVSAQFNEAENSALLFFSPSQAISNINITAMKLGPTGSTITPDYTQVHDFSQSVSFTVKAFGRETVWKVTAMHSSEDVMTGVANAWALFADVNGNFAGTGTPAFEYRKANAGTWSTVPTADVTVSGKTFSARIKGLDASTAYEYRAVANGQQGAVKTFETEAAKQIPNMKFDDWYTDESSVVYPNFDLTEANYWWDSGNGGAKIVSKNPTSEEISHVIGGKAAKLVSTEAIGVLAAASIFTGSYVKTFYVPPGGELEFGRPYTSRPTRMKGYYDYTPGVIDKVKDPFLDLKNTADKCHIYVLLTDWDEPFTINTQTKTFIDFDNDPGIIAFGDLVDNTGTSGYKEFTIELEYRSQTRKPTYVLVVAAASAYGDYFTGSTSSVLYLDEFEFEFD